MGLRYRLRRARPCDRAETEREHTRPGYRDLLQHGRSDVEGDPARRRCEVRRCRQADPEEGSRLDGYVLRQRIRRARGHWRQTIKAFLEAEAYDGPSIIIAYSHCIGQGYNLIKGPDQQTLAVKSGYWPLVRFNPELIKEGKNPLQLDSKAPSIPLEDYIYNENRYNILRKTIPDEAAKLLVEAQEDVNRRWKIYEHMASMDYSDK